MVDAVISCRFAQTNVDVASMPKSDENDRQ
jgi:hypothetical protein